ncbi:hypothetical protein SCHPADRAFT_897329 [Schizopora paradoxa]|uniref:Uncharacterized protein n=1 Tax=Schizopora paradoxa TaxID=27342 RepID=A0A0H2QWX0_9AGAM|nr:hypothetical protein SCHPADRAFT_897329 [Schizopora paradoxa]
MQKDWQRICGCGRLFWNVVIVWTLFVLFPRSDSANPPVARFVQYTGHNNPIIFILVKNGAEVRAAGEVLWQYVWWDMLEDALDKKDCKECPQDYPHSPCDRPHSSTPSPRRCKDHFKKLGTLTDKAKAELRVSIYHNLSYNMVDKMRRQIGYAKEFLSTESSRISRVFFRSPQNPSSLDRTRELHIRVAEVEAKGEALANHLYDLGGRVKTQGDIPDKDIRPHLVREFFEELGNLIHIPKDV